MEDHKNQEQLSNQISNVTNEMINEFMTDPNTIKALQNFYNEIGGVK